MQRSKKRKLHRKVVTKMVAAPLAITTLALSPLAFAVEGSANFQLEEIVVTAQKRAQNLQDVPISIKALGTQQLSDLNITDFDDFAKMLPSVSFQSTQPGFAQVYMRGVASGGDGNHSGSQPSVGMYLDEQPITTIQGSLDVHVYDFARVESLAGPQGTLYGASSQAGTIRLITNKPDPSAFEASYSLEGNMVDGDDTGHVAEGFVNLPVSDNAAIRLVGWSKHDAGYIDNVETTRVFPSSGIAMNNAARKEDNYNDADTVGARAALRVDLNDSWTITPSIMGQQQKTQGVFGYDSTVGEDKISHNFPENSNDRWVQAALTVEGSISDFDIVYAGSSMKRDVDYDQDYNDYAFWYDTLAGYGAYFYDDDSNLVNPAMYIQGADRYTKQSHELRISSPQDESLRFVAGLFWQEQTHDIEQRYLVDDIATSIEVPGWEDTIWLTKQDRTDKDKAVFGEVSYDFTDKFTMTAGVRYFEAENSLRGFYGYGSGYSSWAGEVDCFTTYDTDGAPCVNLDKATDEKDHIVRLNATYQLDEDKMIYATFSEGYRPGGINRRGTVPPYVSDFLTNYEFGWKTTWMDNRLMVNGAIFLEEWDDFQFSVLGANGLTEIRNANSAEILGLEADFSFAATANLTLSGGVAYYDAELTEDYCNPFDSDGVTQACAGDAIQAPDGTRLPVTAEFKGNITGRYTFALGDYDAHFQTSVVYEGQRETDLRLEENAIMGDMDAYTIVDLSAGIETEGYGFELYVKNAFNERAELSKYSQCAEGTCGQQTYVSTNQPRTVGVKYTQRF